MERTEYGLHTLEPILPVRDVAASAEFYRDRLGFTIDFMWEDPPTHARVSRGVAIRLSRALWTADITPSVVLFIHLTEDLEGLFEEFRSQGVKILEEPTTEPGRLREFQIADCNGYRLRFAIDS